MGILYNIGMNKTNSNQNVEANNDKNSFEFGTIGYWKERIDKATDLIVVPTSKSINQHWDRGMWNYFKVLIVVDGKIEDVRFTDNETKENLKRLPIKKQDKVYKFHESVIGSNRFHEILYHLSSKLYNEGYYLVHKFPNYQVWA